MPPPSLMDVLRGKYGERLSDLLLPPPVFTTMEGEFVSLDLNGDSLVTRFPVLESYLNPYRSVQGGIIAAAVDNTLGPLSMVVAPPNVTRRLEMKYSRPVTPESDHITVTGRLVERKGRYLTFSAEVRDSEGRLVARARATHWVVGEP